MRLPRNIKYESFLIGVLYLIGTPLSLYEDVLRIGRPYVYSTILMIQLYIIKSWMRIPSNNTLHYFLSIKCNNDKLLQVCKIHQIPDRRTIDRRFQVLPISIISTMGHRFISEGLIENNSASVDSTMLKSNGPVWHIYVNFRRYVLVLDLSSLHYCYRSILLSFLAYRLSFLSLYSVLDERRCQIIVPILFAT